MGKLFFQPHRLHQSKILTNGFPYKTFSYPLKAFIYMLKETLINCHYARFIRQSEERRVPLFHTPLHRAALTNVATLPHFQKSPFNQRILKDTLIKSKTTQWSKPVIARSFSSEAIYPTSSLAHTNVATLPHFQKSPFNQRILKAFACSCNIFSFVSRSFFIALALILFFAPNKNAFANGKQDIENKASEQVADPASKKVSNKQSKAVFITKKTRDGYKKRDIEGGPLSFDEVWGWVIEGKEKDITSATVLSDIGYFASEIDIYGHLTQTPKRSSLKLPKSLSKKVRVHLVLVCNSKSLTHFVLDPRFNLTEKLLGDIMTASKGFDGVQVDYELIPEADTANFMNFLERLAKKVHEAGKMFSICVPARTRLLKNDAFPYAAISAFSDRVIVMAYDEHWSTSAPGPIASVAWCRNVAKYSMSVVGQKKLVMGLPFYGRSWVSEKFDKAWSYSGVKRIIKNHECDNVRYENDIPTVSLRATGKVTCYFEDAYSTSKKLSIYKNKGVSKVAFWRIGLEDEDTWDYIKLNESAE